MARNIPFIIIALALIGLGDASYLSYAHYTGSALECNIFAGCETVTQSPYSTVLGVHLSYWGLLYYIGALLVAVLLAIRPSSRFIRIGMFGVATIGILFSAYATYLQAFAIDAWCQYCVISGIITVFLFAFSLF